MNPYYKTPSTPPEPVRGNVRNMYTISKTLIRFKWALQLQQRTAERSCFDCACIFLSLPVATPMLSTNVVMHVTRQLYVTRQLPVSHRRCGWCSSPLLVTLAVGRGSRLPCPLEGGEFRKESWYWSLPSAATATKLGRNLLALNPPSGTEQKLTAWAIVTEKEHLAKVTSAVLRLEQGSFCNAPWNLRAPREKLTVGTNSRWNIGS